MVPDTFSSPLDTPCPRCGYDLTGLSPDGQCPECGGANKNALDPYRLANGSPAFVKRLHLGATLTQIWAAISVALLLSWGAAGLVGFRPTIVYTHYLLFHLGMEILRFVAWWLVSSPNLSNPSFAKHHKSRRLFRALLIANLAASVVVRGSLFMPILGNSGLLMAIDVMKTLSFPAAFIASIVYLRSLACRIPSDRLHRRATIILRVIIVAIVLDFCTRIPVPLGSSLSIKLWVSASSISGIAMYLPYFFLLHSTRQELRNVRALM